MTDFNIKLHALPFAHRIDRGWNKKGEVYDIEVLSGHVLTAWDQHCEKVLGFEGGAYDDRAFPLFREWCNRNNVFYYGAVREEFSEREALDMAADACARFLLMEDLS